MEGECLALKDLTSPRKSVAMKDGHEGEDGGQGDHKENIYTERVRSTPLSSADSTAPPLLMNRRGANPDLTQITPIKLGALAEPLTPTANLKILVSAASPDIRDREMKKVLFRPIENDREQTARTDAAVEEEAEADDPGQFDAAFEDDDAEKKPSRKQKSLGLLCQKFLALYPDSTPLHSPIRISLDEVANSLGVERRRIYDIVNVLESLAIVGRIAKNSYTWHGRQRLHATLQELQRRGLQHGYHLQMEPAAEAALGREDDGDATNAGINRKDKSLRIMSQKFVMLFLVSQTQTVTLDAAAKVLIEEGQDASSHSKYKTKVRRLYDIANVLTSLGLIRKVHVREERGRKPAFRWLGPVEFGGAGTPAEAQASTAAPTAPDLRRKMTRHASFSVTPTAAAAQRRVSSAPSSPRPELRGPTSQPLDYSRKPLSHGAVCRLQFGNGAETLPSMPLQPPGGSPSPHCLAYLPSLSQPSVLMLYRAAEGRKRRREEEEQQEEEAKRKGGPGSEECLQTAAGPQGGAASPGRPAAVSDAAGASHYLYVPNNAGLNSLNFLLSAGQPVPGVGLPPSGVPALALPCVLVASPALSHFSLLSGGPAVPAMMPPGHFLMGAAPYGGGGCSSPERRRAYGSGAAGAPRSPNTPEPLTPHTPKETGSSSFFQTPGTLGDAGSAAPAGRKRGSAQRRLDVGHPPTA
ncbi:transcription factor E2F7 [Salarias fasciatus]|uniref:transcription factor E2F7 n=1 Tax=Salarias fasciatus TaxID=181472 RepID=UPI0011767967|nr:transcription factor E2F7-like [Salarias fasciatus]